MRSEAGYGTWGSDEAACECNAVRGKREPRAVDGDGSRPGEDAVAYKPRLGWLHYTLSLARPHSGDGSGIPSRSVVVVSPNCARMCKRHGRVVGICKGSWRGMRFVCLCNMVTDCALCIVGGRMTWNVDVHIGPVVVSHDMSGARTGTRDARRRPSPPRRGV